ncbi:MAG: NUDIX domain-containing protein [Microgenomates group bacterium]
MKQVTLEEISAGGVVYRAVHEIPNSNNQVPNKFEFLIGKHSGYHKWVLPKGLVEKGESRVEAATREVMEEVGVEAKIVEMVPLQIVKYYYFADMGEIINKNPHTEDTTRRVKTYQEDPAFAKASAGKARVHKQVVFYLMEVEKDLGGAGWEMEERKWVSYDEGMKMLAFETEREVFEAAWKELNGQ